jgi:ABC-type phosphate transport system substrate-binding protein
MTAATRRPSAAGVFNVVAGLVLALVVAVLALRASSSQPPAIAEFAPQAQQQIKQAPQEQTSLSGNGEGAAIGAFLASPSPLASLLPTASPPSEFNPP